MIRSMTGFATQSLQLIRGLERSNVNISIKSLNSRYFEVSYKMPYILSSLEHEITKLLKQELVRGHVTVSIHMSNPALFKGTIEPAMGTINGYIKALEQIKKTSDVSGAVSLDALITLPNVFIVEEQDVDDASRQAILQSVGQAIEALIKGQDAEGAILRKDLENRAAIMQSEISAIETESAELLDAQKKKVQHALQEIAQDESKLAEIQKNSLYAMLDKIDTHEEVVRFKNHLTNFNSLLHATMIEIGKRLDFTLQELAREINTISAKCSDSQISTRAINVKVELEKAREQVQNIV